MKMQPDQFAAAVSHRFGQPGLPRAWVDYYTEEILPRPDSFLPPFSRQTVRAIVDDLIASPEIRAATMAAADAILSDRPLGLAGAVASHFVFDAPEHDPHGDRELLVPAMTAEPAIRLFYAPILASRVPTLLHEHARLGIAVTDTMDLLTDVERWVREYQNRHGVLGLSEIGWLRSHFRLKVFQFGRLQYEPHAFDWPYRVYRRDETDECVVLVEAGRRFRDDGQFHDADLTSHYPPKRSPAALFEQETVLIGSSGRIRGHPVDARTGIRAEPVEIDATAWSEIAGPGTTTLAVHIPASGPLEPVAVDESLRRAAHHFGRSAETAVARLFTCESWLMDRQLDAYLPATANLIRFQRRFFPLPLPGADDHQHFERVFATPPHSLDDAARTTTLQRAIVDHVRAGCGWRMTGGITTPSGLRPPGAPIA